MASRRNFYFNRLVTEDDINFSFDGLEDADHALASDFDLVGVARGMELTQHSTPNLTVDVGADGSAYDADGQRIRNASLQVVDVSVDSSSVSTAVAAPGNEKWVSVFIRFKRVLSDSQVDGNSNTVFFVQDEGFEFVVTQGAEALLGAGVRSALLADSILLGDVRRTFGQTTILNADISAQVGTGPLPPVRRQDAFVLTNGSNVLRAGTPESAAQALFDFLVASGSGAIAYNGSPNWADATNVPAGTLESGVDGVVSALAGTLGAAKVGIAARTAWLDTTTNPAGSVFAAVEKVITDLIRQNAGSSGLAKVGVDALANWFGGRTNPATDARTALNKIIVDLGVQTLADDGAERVGASAGALGDLVIGSVRSQLNQLEADWGKLARANVWQLAPQTFRGNTADADPALITDHVISTSRKLLWQVYIHTNARLRLYARAENGATTDGRGLDVTINALWSDGSNNWSKDDTALPSTWYEFGGETSESSLDSYTALTIRGRAAGAGTWTAWDDPRLRLLADNPADGTTVAGNTLTAKGIVKAMVYMTTDGVGGFTLHRSINVASAGITLSATDISITMLTAMTDTSYGLDTGDNNATAGTFRHVKARVSTSSVFLVQIGTATGTVVDPTATAVSFTVTAWGLQSQA